MARKAKKTYLSNKQIALRACADARSYILEGCTQLKNNEYTLEHKNALGKAVEDVRQDTYKNIENTINAHISRFEHAIANCRKFSIGNCHELGLLALNFVIKNRPNIFAEVYHIKGGDHVFLVIGRNKNSDPKDPKTWGEAAYICDPWSNAVYPASEYLTKTKNYTHEFTYTGVINKTEPFDPKRHTLAPIENLNSEYLVSHTQDANKAIIQALSAVYMNIVTTTQTLIDDLKRTGDRIKAKYEEDNPKCIILVDKIRALEEIARAIQSDYEQHASLLQEQLSTIEKTSNKYYSPLATSDDLARNLAQSLRKIYHVTNVSKDEYQDLRKPKEHSFSGLFGFNSQTIREYEGSVSKNRKEMNKSAEDLSNLMVKK